MFAYHLGDLDDFHFPRCQWAADYLNRARIEEAVLIYSGVINPTVLAFGIGNRFAILLEELIDLLPQKFFCHYQKKYLGHFLEQYDQQYLGSHIKMKQATFKKYKHKNSISGEILRLNDTHIQQLLSFYKVAFTESYFDKRMLRTGLCFGYFENGELLSAAGVHVDSEEYSVTALGNIATHPQHRGKGLAKAVTSRLLNEINSKRNVITLNVKADNFAAISCYEKLGFKKSHDYEESIFIRKS